MPVNMVTLAGPWSGIEEREQLQDESTASISLNVDYSRGFIEGRPGAETLAHIADNDTISYRTQLFLYQPVVGDPLILVVGVKYDPENHNLSTGDVVFRAFNIMGHPRGALQNLTTDFGEPPNTSFTCAFMNAVVATTSFESRHVVVITTPYGSYIYDPVENAIAVRRLDPAVDGYQDDGANISYMMNSPGGRITKRHLGFYFFAGLRGKYTARLSSPIEAEQNVMAEYLLNSDRAEITFSPEHVYYSEPEHIGDFPFWNHEVVEIGERITGLESLHETLVVLTERGVYNISAASPESFMTVKTINNAGCIAPGSVVSAGDVVYFMGIDGIYGYAGAGQQGAIAKISEPIGSMFGESVTSSHVPEKSVSGYGYLPALLRQYGWPWHIDRKSLHMCQAMHIASKNQIWWSIPVSGNYAMKFLATLVYDYVQKAWSIYSGTLASTTTPSRAFFYSGDTLRSTDGEQVYFTDTVGRIKKLLKRGDKDRDRPGVTGLTLLSVSGSKDEAPHMVWMSGKILGSNETMATLRPIRLRCLGGFDGEHGRIACFCEGEEGHADAVYLVDGDSDPSASADRQLSDKTNIVLHAAGDDAKSLKNSWNLGPYAQWTNGTSSGTTTFKWSGVDWISRKIELGSVRSKSFRIGLVDSPIGHSGKARGTSLVVDSIGIEIDTGGAGGDTR